MAMLPKPLPALTGMVSAGAEVGGVELLGVIEAVGPVDTPNVEVPELLRPDPERAELRMRVKSALARTTRASMETCLAFLSSLVMMLSMMGICDWMSEMISVLERTSTR